MMRKENLLLAGLAVLCFSFILFGGAVPAQADDGTFGSELSPADINQLFTHTDADDGYGYKGFFMLWTQNSTSTAWTGFNLTIDSAVSDAVFIDTATWDAANPTNPCTNWATDLDCDPTSSFGVSGWSITNGGLDMSVTLNSNWGAGQVGWLKVYTDNSSSQNATFNITVDPILVPEPVSSSLFLVGAATLGYRRFSKRFTK